MVADSSESGARLWTGQFWGKRESIRNVVVVIRSNGHHLPVAVVAPNPSAYGIILFVDLEFPIFGQK